MLISVWGSVKAKYLKNNFSLAELKQKRPIHLGELNSLHVFHGFLVFNSNFALEIIIWSCGEFILQLTICFRVSNFPMVNIHFWPSWLPDAFSSYRVRNHWRNWVVNGPCQIYSIYIQSQQFCANLLFILDVWEVSNFFLLNISIILILMWAVSTIY